MITDEEARRKLDELNVLMKYMDFLIQNGLSECGRGQIIGQISLLEEYLSKNNQISNSTITPITNKNIEKDSFKDTNPTNGGIFKEMGNIFDKAKDVKKIIKTEYMSNGSHINIAAEIPPMGEVHDNIDNKIRQTWKDKIKIIDFK